MRGPLSSVTLLQLSFLACFLDALFDFKSLFPRSTYRKWNTFYPLLWFNVLSLIEIKCCCGAMTWWGVGGAAVSESGSPIIHPSIHPSSLSPLIGPVPPSVPSLSASYLSWQLACWAADTYPAIRGFADTTDQTSTSFSEERNKYMIVFYARMERKSIFFSLIPLFDDKSIAELDLKLLLVSLGFLNHMSAAPNEVCRPSVWLL